MPILTLRVRADLDNQRYDNPSTPAGALHESYRLRNPLPTFYETGSDAEKRQRKICLAFRIHDNWKQLKMDTHSKNDYVMLEEMQAFEMLQDFVNKLTPLKIIRQGLQEKIDGVAPKEVEVQGMTIPQMHERIDIRNKLQVDLNRVCANIKAVEDEMAAVEKKRDQDLASGEDLKVERPSKKT